MPERRNIILITFDSLRADHCSFMGYHRETTPTLDKMARKGLYFENAIVSVPGTTSSIMGVFTGEYAVPDFRGLVAQSWEKEVSKGLTSLALERKSSWISEYWRNEIKSKKTLAQALASRGYNTGAFHANPAVSSYFGFNKGFKTFQDFLSENGEGVRHKIYTKLFIPVILKLGIGSIFRGFMDFIKGRGVFMDWENFYDLVIDWVEKSTQPFFLWILLMDTHAPYKPPRKYRRWSRSWDIYWLNWKLYRGGFTRPNFTEKEREGIINAYDDAIYYADCFIKNLLKDLNDYDPIFIIHGDHGDGFCEHGFYGHPQMLYEELIHVPLIIYNADVKGKVEKPVSLLGIAPTILELIGMKNEFPSESLLHGGKDWVIVKAYGGKIAVRTKEWKYIVGQKEEEELYYLKKDPHEQVNLIYEYPKLVDEFKKIVDLHIKCESEKRKIHDIARRLRYQGGTRHG